MRMTYAGDRIVHDADSHLMEPPGWLAEHAAPDIRDRVPPLDLKDLAGEAEAAIRAHQARPGQLGDTRDPRAIITRKNWTALGAFDPRDRSRALDTLGFRSQLVFSTYS